MQYTAKKTFNSVLIIRPDGMRYRFQEDHLFKDIRYAQVTKVVVKTDRYRKFHFYCCPFLVLGNLHLMYADGFHWSNISNALALDYMFGVYLSMKKVYFVHVIDDYRGFATHQRKEAYAIKKAIESHC